MRFVTALIYTSESRERFDWSGTINGCLILGDMIDLCRFGCTAENDDCAPSDNGWVNGSFDATVDPEGKTISLTWSHSEGSGSDTYTKRDCRPKGPEDWGLPTDREWIREDQFGGSVQSQVIFRAVDNCTPAGFNAGVFGTVTRVDADSPTGFTIEVTTSNGDRISYSSGSPPGAIAVNVGDPVTPSTFLGSVADPCLPGLFINGVTNVPDSALNPDCVQ